MLFYCREIMQNLPCIPPFFFTGTRMFFVLRLHLNISKNALAIAKFQKHLHLLWLSR